MGQKSEKISLYPPLKKGESKGDLKGKKVLVVGLARTGISVARFLNEKGAVVTATDVLPESKIKGIDALRNAGIKVEVGRHSLKYFLDAALIVLSPGVPPDIAPLQQARKKGVDIISEIELASHFIQEPLLAIAGTNGKTTTTTLMGKVLEDAGKAVFVGGNIGLPLIEYVASGHKADCLVVEASSFQLEGIRQFKPHIAVLLNITEDHLDRYADFDEYAAAKFRLFKNMDKGDFAIVNIDDATIKPQISYLKSQICVLPFSSSKVLKEGIYYKNGEIACSVEGKKEFYPTEDFKLKGIHNIENIMAAIAAARLCGISQNRILKTVNEFKGLPHRMELIRELKGIAYYNDSKGTNIGALQKSLDGVNSSVILIAGGKDKGGDYRVLYDLIKKKVKLLILLGEAKDKIKEAFSGLTAITMVESLKDAVDLAHNKAAAGDVVLLSPACSSFDMFKDYKERGDLFRKFVNAL
ncbi:MAG: UDP-N-acetylmuramoyl-L-alanine--D-glutamate ligase [Deltaproteobacteria bacterium]|nr:UDP-N-acetylmuramoyl-L-alanine--D-glutamate ligase [Deltaproteobacteria bacterium]MBI3756070.1 UDP-N-acetylmuramoyl-L-alanine--D-glutamate ligase [Deltaproteobacteria bacterium]